jgi:hypothetical protein
MALLDNKEEFFSKKIELDSYILTGEINDFDLIDKLIQGVKEGVKISEVSGKTNVTGEHTEFNHFLPNPYFHKFLKIIQPSIYKIYQNNFIIKDVWGNIYSKNTHQALPHIHDDSAFCGILYCTDGPGPGTYFSQYDLTIDEKKGKFVLFDPKLLHEVKPYDYKSERITIAWNFSAMKTWGKYDNFYIINKNKEIVL